MRLQDPPRCWPERCKATQRRETGLHVYDVLSLIARKRHVSRKEAFGEQAFGTDHLVSVEQEVNVVHLLFARRPNCMTINQMLGRDKHF